MAADRAYMVLLGGFALFDRAGREIVLQRQRVRDLLTVVALSRNRTAQRSILVDLFWPHLVPAKGKHNLRQTVLTASRVLAGAGMNVLETTQETVSLPPDLDVDVLLFRARISDVGRLAAGVDLYAGPLRVDAEAGDDVYGDWLQAARRGLEDEAIAAYTRLIDARQQDDPERAIAAAQRVLEIDPTREDAHRRLMDLLMQAGRPGSAIAQYRRCCEVLRTELNVEPEPETTRLYERLTRHCDDEQAGREADGEAAARDSDGGLVGRAAEVAAVRRCLQRLQNGPGGALVFKGASGLGKSTLLAHVEHRAAAFGYEVRRAACSPFDRRVAFAVSQRLLGGAETVMGGRKPRADGPQTGLSEPVFQSNSGSGRVGDADGATKYVCLVDDLHDADRSSVEHLLDLAYASSPPVLLVASWDPGFDADGWLSERLSVLPNLDHVHLRPFKQTETNDLALAGVEEGRNRIKKNLGRIHRLSGGNPGAVLDVIEAFNAGEADWLTATPKTISAWMRRRTRNLSQDARAVLSAGAVLGEAPDWQAACALAGIVDGTAPLRALVDSGLCIVRGGHLRFAEPWVQTCVYDQLTSLERCRTHEAAARLLVERAPRDGHPAFDEIVHHFFEADCRLEAAETALDQGVYEEDRCRPGRARIAALRAVRLADGCDPSARSRVCGLRGVALDLRCALQQDERAEARAAFMDLKQRRLSVTSPSDQAHAHVLAARVASLAGDPNQSLEELHAAAHASQAAALQGDCPHPHGAWDDVDRWLVEIADVDDVAATRARAEAARAHAAALGRHLTEVRTTIKVALCDFAMSHPRQAIGYLETAAQRAERTALTGLAAHANAVAALFHAMLGEGEASDRAMGRARSFDPGPGEPLRQVAMDALDGGRRVYGAQPQEALAPLEQVLGFVEQSGLFLYKPLCLAWRSLAAVRASSGVVGRSDIDEAHAAAAAANCSWALGVADRALATADLLAPGPDVKGVIERTWAAVEVQDSASQPLEAGRTLDILARLYRRRGDFSAASEMFDRAAGLFEEHGASSLASLAHLNASALRKSAS